MCRKTVYYNLGFVFVAQAIVSFMIWDIAKIKVTKHEWPDDQIVVKELTVLPGCLNYCTWR